MSDLVVYFCLAFLSMYVATRLLQFLFFHLHLFLWKRWETGIQCHAVALIFALATSIGATIHEPLIELTKQETVVAQVIWKERVSYGTLLLEHRYLVFARLEDGTPFVMDNADCIIHKKFNSSNFYTLLEIGGWYTFQLAGQRLPFVSTYPNIHAFTLLDRKEGLDPASHYSPTSR